jgi:hypothetical protein
MQPGTILTIGPLPAHMRAMESRIVHALPVPRAGMVRHTCAFVLASCSVFAVAFLWSLVGAP